MAQTRDYPPIVSQIVDRCYVGQSNRQVIRYFISRLKHGYRTWAKMPRNERRQWLVWVIACHADNRKLYREVMA
jgi:cytochrome c-type biogenesis protein CcmH/NrfF